MEKSGVLGRSLKKRERDEQKGGRPVGSKPRVKAYLGAII